MAEKLPIDVCSADALYPWHGRARATAAAQVPQSAWTPGPRMQVARPGLAQVSISLLLDDTASMPPQVRRCAYSELDNDG